MGEFWYYTQESALLYRIFDMIHWRYELTLRRCNDRFAWSSGNL